MTFSATHVEKHSLLGKRLREQLAFQIDVLTDKRYRAHAADGHGGNKEFGHRKQEANLGHNRRSLQRNLQHQHTASASDKRSMMACRQCSCLTIPWLHF